jgi:SAM-dependent methyltransferase
MPNQSDSYNISAKHYDAAYASMKNLVDLPFYLDLARKSSGPVLELACGTGRVLLNIARQCIEIDGVDNSAPMLHVLRSSLEKEPLQVRQKVTLHEGDMRTFRANKKYRLVIMPFRSMQHMFTIEDQLAALRTTAAHLDDNSLLAFDVFYPRFDLLAAGIGEEKLELEWPVPGDPHKIVRRYFRKESFDKIHQIFTATFIFRTYVGDKLLHEETEPLKMSYYAYPQLQSLFLLAGLESVEEFGSFARAPLDNSSDQMIFVLKKAPHSSQ